MHRDPDSYVRRALVKDLLGWARRRGTPSQPHDAIQIRRTAARDLVDTDAVWAACSRCPSGSVR